MFEVFLYTVAYLCAGAIFLWFICVQVFYSSGLSDDGKLRIIKNSKRKGKVYYDTIYIWCYFFSILFSCWKSDAVDRTVDRKNQ